jgi:hypothetical protein
MANTANAVWRKTGPAFTFQQVAFGGADVQEMAYRGTATFTGDAASTTVTINFIDGTQTPFFTPGNPPTAVAPTIVLAQVNSGGVTATVNILGVTSITTTGFVITGEGNWPATAFTIGFIVIP